MAGGAVVISCSLSLDTCESCERVTANLTKPLFFFIPICEGVNEAEHTLSTQYGRHRLLFQLQVCRLFFQRSDVPDPSGSCSRWSSQASLGAISSMWQ